MLYLPCVSDRISEHGGLVKCQRGLTNGTKLKEVGKPLVIEEARDDSSSTYGGSFKDTLHLSSNILMFICGKPSLVILHMFDIPPTIEALDGVKIELHRSGLAESNAFLSRKTFFKETGVPTFQNLRYRMLYISYGATISEQAIERATSDKISFQKS
ncbi:unnamed protein product [Dovyalis caffra]|uniref:Uncharacterized protein n=1 Tax=Dovyalis caffra TaxID=77055 RepID=A0AAV1S2G8_9ROSI|nr:unnamed protein product [Dovyalis caffra]